MVAAQRTWRDNQEKLECVNRYTTGGGEVARKGMDTRKRYDLYIAYLNNPEAQG